MQKKESKIEDLLPRNEYTMGF